MNPRKQPTMPFKQKMGILQGREKRREREVLEAKESGRVLANQSSSQSKTSAKKRNTDSGLDVQTKGGVLRLSKARLPPKLWKKK